MLISSAPSPLRTRAVGTDAFQPERVISMGIGMMVVMIIMTFPMMMPVIMLLIETAGAGAEAVAKVTILDRAARCCRTLPFHKMVMAFLGQPDFGLESQNLRSVFAKSAVHEIGTVQDFSDPLREGFHDLGVIVQITGLHHLNSHHPVKAGHADRRWLSRARQPPGLEPDRHAPKVPMSCGRQRPEVQSSRAGASVAPT